MLGNKEREKRGGFKRKAREEKCEKNYKDRGTRRRAFIMRHYRFFFVFVFVVCLFVYSFVLSFCQVGV